MIMSSISIFLLLIFLSELAPGFASESGKMVLCGETMIPAIEWMGKGVDISAIDLTSGNGQQKEGLLEPLFNWTCNLNRTWAHESTPNNLYHVPDQVSIETLEFGKFNTTVSLSRKLGKYRQTQTANISFSEGEASRKFLFSANSKFHQTIMKMYHGNKTIAEVSKLIFKSFLNCSI